MHDLKDGKFNPSSAGMHTIQVNNSQLTRSWVLDIECGFYICYDLKGLIEDEEVEHGRIDLIMGNRRSSLVTKIGTYGLVLGGDVRIVLINYCYSSEMM